MDTDKFVQYWNKNKLEKYPELESEYIHWLAKSRQLHPPPYYIVDFFALQEIVASDSELKRWRKASEAYRREQERIQAKEERVRKLAQAERGKRLAEEKAREAKRAEEAERQAEAKRQRRKEQKAQSQKKHPETRKKWILDNRPLTRFNTAVYDHRLKPRLESGEITQEQYDAEIGELKRKYGISLTDIK